MTDTLHNTQTEYEALTSQQQDQVLAGGVIAGLPMHCEYCPEMAVWSSADGNGRAAVACYDLRHIAFSMSLGSGADPDDLLGQLACHNRNWPTPGCTCP